MTKVSMFHHMVHVQERNKSVRNSLESFQFDFNLNIDQEMVT